MDFNVSVNCTRARAQELCESRSGRPGLPVPNKPYGFCGHKATLNLHEGYMWTNHTIKVLSTPVSNDGACHQITSEKPVHTSRHGAVNSRQTQVSQNRQPILSRSQVTFYCSTYNLITFASKFFQDVFSNLTKCKAVVS